MKKHLQTNKLIRVFLTAVLIGFAGTTNLIAQISQGAISGGLFTVNSTGDKVVFSQGNLQYIGSASTPYWKFADNQWDCLGTTTGQNSSNQNVDRDLFGWGTSGFNHGAVCYQPWSTSNTYSHYYVYGNSLYNLYSQSGQADWGYNAISNGGNTENSGWRTLTIDEWTYVFNTRSTPSGKRYAKAKVNNVNGVILLPDGWSTSVYSLNNTNSNTASYDSNVISVTQWPALEQAGAVFLPAAHKRDGTSLWVGSTGYYWSASRSNNSTAYGVDFSSNYLYLSYYNRDNGRSVRLVCPAFNINATPNPTEGGAVSGGGTYTWGADCTLTATPSAGYAFANWMENGNVVSTEATYTFTVTSDRSLVANFAQEGIITFADANVKALCVSNWDTNGDGELSYVEAAYITSLGNVFKDKTNIHSFNELQYFIFLGSIGEQAFYGCTELTQITIPEAVSSVGSKAFWNCPALQTVKFNAINCTSMKTTYNNQTYSVFSSDASGGTPAVKSVVIANGVTHIPDYAFKNCAQIYPGMTIRSTVTEIGAHAFENCSSMTTLSFQNNSTLATIGEYAFSGCSALNKALNLPNSVTTLGQYAFYGCVAIPSLTIGAGMETIGGYAFWNCPAMATVNFNATNCTSMVTYSQYSVFNAGTSNGGSTPIVTLTIGENVTKIPNYAFRNSTNMTSVITIPDVTTTIGQYAFYGAHSPELTIGEGVTTIGDYAFWNCPAMATVNFNATNCTSMVTYSQYSVFNAGTSNGGSTPIVTLTIGENVTKIPNYAFRNSTNMTSVITIPDVTTTIGQYAFCGAHSPELTIGEGVTTIGDYAFWNCPAMTTVNFNATNCTQMFTRTGTSQSNYQYYSVFNTGTSNGGATPIVALTIGDNVTNIPDYAFRNSANMTSTIAIPDTTTNIGQYAFYGCSLVPCVATGNGVATIGQYAFHSCSSLNLLTIGTGVASIGDYAFWNCPNLATVHFNATNCTTMVTNSQLSVFNVSTSYNGATPIVTLTLGDNVTKIPNFAFTNSTNMTGDLLIPNSVISIGQYAFANCGGHNVFTGSNVNTIHPCAFKGSSFNGTLMFGDADLFIGERAFDGCNSFTGDLFFPNTVNDIGQYAFQNCSGFNGTLTLPVNESYTIIQSYTFNGCSGLTGPLTIPATITRIRNQAFSFCNSFVGTLVLNNTITTIEQSAFFGCSGFTGDLVIPHSVTSLGGYTFSGCSGFDGSLILGNGIQTINVSTFDGCSGFSGALILGTQVNNIGQYAFKNCSAFSLLITENANPITATSSSFTGMTYTIPVYVPDGLIGNYQSATGWSSFTNYIEQYTFWQEVDTDNWSDELNWLSMEVPSANDVVCVTYNCNVDIDVDVLHVYVYNINDVLTVQSGKTLNTTYGVGVVQPSQLVMEEGSQLYNTIPGVSGTVKKQITGYGTGNDGWYTIAAPIYAGMPVNTLATGNYDLYAYDEPTAMWLNQKVPGNFDELNPAQGYLYASQTGRTANFAGQLNASNAEISIPVTYTSGELAGFNLVGNPYTNNINIGNVKINGTAQTAFYRAEGGSSFVAYVAADNEPIKPGDGFMVKATEAGTLTFDFTPSREDAQQGSYVRLVLNKDNQVADRAYLVINKGETLEKMSTANAHSKLYFKNGNDRYAVAENESYNGSMPLYLENAFGRYTIESSLLNAQCDYLHLIDNITGDNIDLLKTPSYTFMSSPRDREDRFTLVFDAFEDVDNEVFAYQNGDDIVVSGNGELQIFDVMGRMVATQRINGVETYGCTSLQTGVYIFRLVGNEVKSQKIVVD